MSEQNTPLNIEFAPGCFDNFDGTQEELDALIKEIHQLAESGDLFEKAISLDDPSNEISEEFIEQLEYDSVNRKLQ